MTNNAFVLELKSRIDIHDLIAESVTLRKSGANWLGLCPFHAEKTPSFTVNPSRQIFHCFGCGAGGDVIAFVMKRESVTFREALELLARRCGMEVPGYDARRAEGKDRLLQVFETARVFYRSNLSRNERAREYLRERGLTDALAETFSIGSSPEDWQALTRHLQSRRIPETLLLQSGLVAQGRNQTLYDVFRGRLIFPINSLYGRTVGFGGRALLKDQTPKYLNSRESEAFQKSRMLYALDLAKDAIRSEGYALLTEGYLDTITCHQFGFRNAVATLGTAFGEGHAKLLKRFADRVVLVFDGDAAGIQAARRSLRILIAEGLDPRILILPDKHDPDTFLRTRGREEFAFLLRQAGGLVEFLLDDALKKKASEPGLARVTEAISVIAEIPNALAQGQALHDVSERTGIPERFLIEELGRHRSPLSARKIGTVGEAQPAGCRDPAEELLLGAAIQSQERIKRLSDQFTPSDFRDDLVRAIFVKLTGVVQSGEMWDPDEFLASLPEDGSRSLLTRLLVQENMDTENAEDVFNESVESLKRRNLLASHKDLVTRIGKLDREAMDRFLKEQRKLKRPETSSDESHSP